MNSDGEIVAKKMGIKHHYCVKPEDSAKYELFGSYDYLLMNFVEVKLWKCSN
jgi:hypothetical protein